MTANFGDARLSESFWNKVSPCPMTGCWLWTASLKPDGYGRSYEYGGHLQRLAHRTAYERLVGPIPADLQVDHLCRVRSCCNPAHLELVTTRENTMRGISFSAVNAAKTSCVNGHPLVGKNLYVRRDGTRKCYACAMACSRAAKAKSRAHAQGASA